MAPRYHRPALRPRRPGAPIARAPRQAPAGVAPSRDIRALTELIGTAAGPGPDAAAACGGPIQQWCDGVALVRGRTGSFADYWHRHNDRALTGTGPLWAVLGDSTAQGLGADHPQDGYVGQVHAEVVRRTGTPWRVVNLSSSGATTQDVIRGQLLRLACLPAVPDLVTCGVGTNDLLRVPLPRLRALFRALIDALPDNAVVLDLPLPENRWRVGRLAAPYVARVNSAIYAAARARPLPVAYVSGHFTPPWAGKFSADDFHPNGVGYRDWCRAVLQAIPDMPLPAMGPIGNH
jgi:acyl-CoA thioesterase-1